MLFIFPVQGSELQGVTPSQSHSQAVACLGHQTQGGSTPRAQRLLLTSCPGQRCHIVKSGSGVLSLQDPWHHLGGETSLFLRMVDEGEEGGRGIKAVSPPGSQGRRLTSASKKNSLLNWPKKKQTCSSIISHKKIKHENKNDSKLFYSEFIFSGNKNKIGLLHESFYIAETGLPEMACYRSLKETAV